MQSLASIRLVIKEYWETAFDIFSVTISSVAAFFKLHPGHHKDGNSRQSQDYAVHML